MDKFAIGLIICSSLASAAIEPLRFEPNRGQSAQPALFLARNADGNMLFTRQEAILPLPSATLRIRPLNALPNPQLEGIEALPSKSEYHRGAAHHRVDHYAALRYRNLYPSIDLIYHGRGREIEYDFVVNPGADHSRIRLEFGGAREARLAPSGDLVIRVGKDYVIQRAPVAYQNLPTGRAAVAVSYRLFADQSVGFRLGAFDRAHPVVIDPVLSATYLGGSQVDVATATAFDQKGGLWVTGYTFSTDFPNFGDPYATENAASTDVFVARYNPDGTLDYVTYLGGDNDDRATAIAIDGAGAAFITGYTASANFPLAGASQQNSMAGVRDIFVARINLEGDRGTGSLWYSTYLGGTAVDTGNAIAVASDGTVWVGGYTASEDFPLIGTPAQPSNRGGYEGVLFHVDSAAGSNSVLYSTYFGGSSTDVITGVATNGSHVIFSGYTMSGDFPVTDNALQHNYAGRGDAFVASLNTKQVGLDAFEYGTYFGGSDLDLSYGLRAGAGGQVYLAGYTMSGDFPVTPTALQTQKNGEADAFISRLNLTAPAAEALTYSTYYGGNSTDIAYGLAVDAAGRLAISGYTYSTNLPLAQPAQESPGGGFDGFVAYIDPNTAGAAGLLFGTYFGGPSTEVAYGVSFDNRGALAIAGFTTSAQGIAAGPDPVQATLAGYTDGFVARYNLCDIAGVCSQ